MYKEDDEEYFSSMKEYVYNWLKRNSYLNEEITTFLNEGPFTKEDRFMLEDLDDIN
jgi:hypothetical protein